MELDPEILMGIYKGLRMPLLGMVLIFIAWYVYRPRKKKDLETAKYNMLDDDVETGLAREWRKKDGHTEAL